MISESETSFENKFMPTEIFGRDGVPVLEFSMRQHWSERNDQDLPLSEQKYASLFFRAHTKRRVYNRDPYKLLELLGDLGGLFDILILIGLLLTNFWVVPHFTAELLKDSYQIQNYSQNKTQYYDS